MSIVGGSGVGVWEQTITGFHARKYSDYRLSREEVLGGFSTTDWIEFRYGEILLNLAEAAFALDNTSEALTAINQVRVRAGIVPLEEFELTSEKIQHERIVELAIESQNYYDIRRWRTAFVQYNEYRAKYLYPYYIYDEDKYIFKIQLKSVESFEEKNYWGEIPGIDKNPKLVQNPFR
jgi:hypothetical protein